MRSNNPANLGICLGLKFTDDVSLVELCDLIHFLSPVRALRMH
jgi:hypothetical protein